ncbi:MAG TPA: hypothetical protein VGJ81_15975 [Thermoanaerobaculia bacterium]
MPEGDSSFAEQLIDLFGVDVLHAVRGSPAIDALIAKYPFLRDSSHLAADIFYEDWHSKKQVLGVLDVRNVVELLWQNEFKGKPADYKSNFVLPKWDAADPLAAVFSLQFGFYPREPDLKWDFPKNFVNGLCAEEQILALDAPLTLQPRKNFGPIDLTSIELRRYGGGIRFASHGLYIGESGNYDDLVAFWNVRAAGNTVVYLATDAMDRTLLYAQAFVDFLDSRANRHPEIGDRIALYCRSMEDEVLRTSVASRIASKKGILWCPVTEHSWNGWNVQPTSEVFKWQSGSTHVEPAYDKYVVNVGLPDKSFLLNADEAGFGRQHFGVVIDVYGELGHPGYTLKVPRIRQLNEFYSREIAVDPWALRVEREGISKIIEASDDSVTLYPISKQLLVEKVFEVAGVKAAVSQPGLIARKLIEKMGGLEDARVLKIRGVRKILQEYKTTDSIGRGEATKTIHEQEFEKYKSLYIEAREKTELESNDVFDYLLRKDFFRAGLDLQCEQCRLVNWLSLKAVDDFWTCEYCGAENRTSVHLRSRGDWRFRKSGLFAKDNNQEGAIPVLLTLLTMKRILDHGTFAYSTALNLNGDNVNCETDLAVLEYGRREEIGIALGECKSEGGSIVEDDCDKLKQAAERLATLKDVSEVFIVFAKTSDGFTAEEVGLFKTLSKEVPLILFTNRELELYHPYWLEDGQIETDVPEKYPNSLADLAQNSATRYLK